MLFLVIYVLFAFVFLFFSFTILIAYRKNCLFSRDLFLLKKKPSYSTVIPAARAEQ